MLRDQLRRWGRYGGALGALMGLWVLMGVGCQGQAHLREQPVALRPPAELVERIEGARADFVGAMGRVATEYDRAVCLQVSAQSAHRFGRQALAEAALEVARARGEARRATQARGGGPAAPQDAITLIEEPDAEPSDPALNWQCVQAQAQPACVKAAANHVALRVYRQRVDGYDLDPQLVSDILEAFGADLLWAGEYLSQPEPASDAFAAIEQGCEAGDSPLKRFLDQALTTSDVARRAGITQLHTDLVGPHSNLCAALPDMYRAILQDLGNSLAHQSRTQYCVNRPWAILE